ncbi:alpha,alpha-trehalase TreF [Alteromonas confluentis]|uniref:Alpha,alpha-trehalase n=1 Tax=Alteromonas confluentis TaxID=1656094 RepID=A0A1E7ZEN3_9ALTE|nr:alpha,alpha-trehalase TreF [Alteromonas confluentis]OFC71973.1 hypothetical protein BFC18_04520 [Alteromonas confluentis]
MEVSAYLASSHQFFSSELFHRVQMAGLFADSKTFADAEPKSDITLILNAYKEQLPADNESLLAFVNMHFVIPTPPQEPEVQSEDLQAYITRLWPALTRKGVTQTAGSLLPLPCDYLVPGGRFREIYYWDSFFTSLGLMRSGYEAQVQSMVDNFISLQQSVGLIPNGSRTYYSSRSQPPVLALMISLLEKNGVEAEPEDLNGYYLQALIREHHFWMNGADEITGSGAIQRAVKLPDGELLNRYWDDSATPRPESYREDVELAQGLSESDAQVFYRNIRAACESGWDFSSRWLADPESLLSIQTTDLIPVDLNCLLVILEQTIARLSAHVHGEDDEQKQVWQQKAQARIDAINKYCWREDMGAFVDFNHKQMQPSSVHALSTVLPLFAGIANSEQADKVAQALQTQFLQKGGLLTSVNQTTQQWDAPNGWAPLQWFAVEALKAYGKMELAEEIANRWLETVNNYYQCHHTLMEKYNVVDTTASAKGGEYEVQHGFGWTNGVVQAFFALQKATQ